MTADQTIDVALGFDRRYAAHGAAVIASVVAHARGAQFRFIILHSGIDRALQARMETAAPGMRFVWIEVGDGDLPFFTDREHFSRATLFRLGLEKLAPADCHRVVYLDADIAVLDDVRKLWALDLSGNPVGAAIDAFVDPVRFAGLWDLKPGHDYFNAGILVIDLDRVRGEGLFTAAADFVARNNPGLNDQCALNWACWGRWTRIGVEWNAQRHMAIPSLIADLSEDKRLNGRMPKIIHFTGPEKPWLREGYHPWAWAYWRSLRRTVFADEVRRAAGFGPLDMLRIWLRWRRRKPAGAAAGQP